MFLDSTYPCQSVSQWVSCCFPSQILQMVATANWPRPATALVLQIEAPQIFAFQLSEVFFSNVFYNLFLNIFQNIFFQHCWLCRNGCAADYQLTEIGRYCFADWFSGSRPFSAPLLVWNNKYGANLLSIISLFNPMESGVKILHICIAHAKWDHDDTWMAYMTYMTHGWQSCENTWWYYPVPSDWLPSWMISVIAVANIFLWWYIFLSR